MAQTEPATRDDAAELFTSRLYAGHTGSGKSTTIGRDIRTLLEADEDYHVIDIMCIPHDRADLGNYRGSFAEVLLREGEDIDPRSTAEEHPYLRINAEWLTIRGDREAVKRVFEQALGAAKENDRKVVVVLDDLPQIDLPGIEEYLSKARSYGAAVWVASLFPVEDDLTSPWSEFGEIVLHSDMSEDPGLDLSDGERSYVSPSPLDGHSENPVLVGTPGQWRKDVIEVPSTDE